MAASGPLFKTVPQWSPVAITGMGPGPNVLFDIATFAPQWSPVAITGMGGDRCGPDGPGDRAAMEPGGDHRDGPRTRRSTTRSAPPQWSPVAITGMG